MLTLHLDYLDHPGVFIHLLDDIGKGDSVSDARVLEMKALFRRKGLLLSCFDHVLVGLLHPLILVSVFADELVVDLVLLC